MAHYLFT